MDISQYPLVYWFWDWEGAAEEWSWRDREQALRQGRSISSITIPIDELAPHGDAEAGTVGDGDAAVLDRE